MRELVSVWAPGGGFAFQPVHNILADVAPENIIAMFKAARELRCQAEEINRVCSRTGNAAAIGPEKAVKTTR